MNASVVHANYRVLERLIADKPVTPENVAVAMIKLNPESDTAELGEITQRLQKGIYTFNTLYAEYGDADGKTIAEGIMEKIVESRSLEERKGFYLDCFEVFRESDGVYVLQDDIVEAPELATLDEEELREIITEQWRNTSDRILTEACVDADKSGSNADISIMDEPLLLAAAYYTSIENGELTEEQAPPPEMLGANAAAYSVISNAAKEGKAVDIKKILIGAALILSAVALILLLFPGFIVLGEVIFYEVSERLFQLGFSFKWIDHVARLMTLTVALVVSIPAVAMFIKGAKTLLEQIKYAIAGFYKKLVAKVAAHRERSASKIVNQIEALEDEEITYNDETVEIEVNAEDSYVIEEDVEYA
jgi:hypothetical protein